jgi:hypothetical protein
LGFGARILGFSLDAAGSTLKWLKLDETEARRKEGFGKITSHEENLAALGRER